MATKTVEKVKEAQLPSTSFFDEADMSGQGVATEQKDFLIPMARVLDPKSSEVEKRGVNYVQGAEPGDIYIKNAPVQIIKGDVGFLFQPCYRDEAVIEWLPRGKGGGGGSGFVARHPADFITNSGSAELRVDPQNPEKKIWFNKATDNILSETRYYGGYVISENGGPPMPLVLPFASTGHTIAKQWNMLMAMKVNKKGQRADIWAVYYRVTTRLHTRRDQAWYLFEIKDAGPVDAKTNLPTTLGVPTREDYERGKALHDSLASGAKQFETPVATENSDTM